MALPSRCFLKVDFLSRSPLVILPLIHLPSYFLMTSAHISTSPPAVSPQGLGLYSQFLPGNLSRMSYGTSVLSMLQRGPTFSRVANDATPSSSLKLKILELFPVPHPPTLRASTPFFLSVLQNDSSNFVVVVVIYFIARPSYSLPVCFDCFSHLSVF